MPTRAVRTAAFGFTVILGTATALLAQAPGGFNIVTAPPKVNVQDKEDVWVLDFQFKSPRVLTVDIPGRGRKTVGYLWYQVWNRTGQPRYFIPDFTVVTNRDTVHHDEVLPRVQAEIAKIEGVPGYDDIKNSVTIAARPIPVTPPHSNPVYVTGVAIFPEVSERVPDRTSFSIFVSGLSNGWTADASGLVRRKTLQLNFVRQADARIQDSRAIKYVGQAWIYRSTGVKVPAAPAAQPPAGGQR